MKTMSNRTTSTEPMISITCCFPTYSVGTKKHFEYYKGGDMIKSFFEKSYSDANDKFF